MICDVWDVVVMPFPFSDIGISRRRPAVVLTNYASFGQKIGVATLGMITTARRSGWPHDVVLADPEHANLVSGSLFRFKFVTASFDRLERKLGNLAEFDRIAIATEVRAALAPL